MSGAARIGIFLAVAALLGAAFIFFAVRLNPVEKADTLGERAGAECVDNPAFARGKTFVQDWQHLINQSDGSKVYFNPFTMTCDEKTGHRLVWVEVSRPRPDQITVDAGAVTETYTFTRDRYLYEIDCGERTFAVLRRELMGEGESVAATLPYAEPGRELKPFTQGGLVTELARPACSTGRT